MPNSIGTWPFKPDSPAAVGEIVAAKLAAQVPASSKFRVVREGVQGNLIVSVNAETSDSDGSGFTVTVKRNTGVVSSSLAGFQATHNTTGIGTPTNVEELEIRGEAGADTFELDALPSVALQKMSVLTGVDNDHDTITLNGKSARPVFDVSANATSMSVNNTGGTPLLVTQVTAQDSLTLNLSAAADTVNVRSVLTGAKTTIRTGDGANTINVGSTAPATTGNVNAFAGELVIEGNSSNDTLNVYDNDGGTNTGFLTSHRIYGLGMSGSTANANGIRYTTIENLNITLGSGPDTFRVQSTAVGTTTTVNTGGGSTNNVDLSSAVSSIGPESGNVNGIAGKLVLIGQSTNDKLNVYDRDSGAVQEGFLTANRIYGLGMPGSTVDTGGVTYQSFESLDVKLGDGADTFTVLGTSSATSTTTIDTGATAANTVNLGGTAATGGNLNAFAGLLVLLAQSGLDTLNVFDQDLALASGYLTGSRIYGLGMPGATATGNGITYGDATRKFRTLNVNLGERADNFTILNTNAATVTTLNAGGGGDTITVDSSAAILTLNGGPDNDIINIRSVMAGATINTGTGTNTVNVGSAVLPGGGNVNAINGLLKITGEGTDTLNVNDTDDVSNNSFLLTTNRLTGLGMTGSGTNHGIDYTSIEKLRIALGGGVNTASVQSTLAETATTISAGSGVNTVHVGSLAPAVGGHVNSIGGKLNVNGSGQNDILHVDDTADSSDNTGLLSSTQLTGIGLGTNVAGDLTKGIEYTGLSAVNLKLGDGRNVFTIHSTHSASTTVNTGTAANKVYIGSVSGAPRPKAGSTLYGIGGQLTVNGQADSDELYIDNSGDDRDGTGELTAATFTHSAMLPESRITYDSFSRIELWLGTGNDQFFLKDTPLGSVTTVNTGSEPTSDNRTNDVINIGGIRGFTTVNAGGGNDVIRVNYDSFGHQTYENGFIANADGKFPELVLHGQNGSDLYEIGLAGTGSSLIRVSDPLDGATDGNPNRMKVYGTPRPDYFLFRPGMIAAVGLNPAGDQTGLAERINYNSTINDIAVYGGDAVDTFVLDDTSSPLTIYGEGGNDVFQIGQIFASPRHPADIPAGSDPDGFDPGLEPGDYFRTTLTTQGFLSNGNGKGNPTTIYGGTGNDNFTVYSNKADLYLFGEQDDDSFTVRAFVKVDPNDPKAPFTNINGGQGADFISYTVNAPVNIEGGDGFDTLTVIGTEFGDDFVITDRGVLGAGLFVRYGGLEKIVVDALEGNDTFFIQSTAESVAVEVVGGLGSDTFHVGGGNDGQAITVVANDLLGHSGLVMNQVSSTDDRYQAIFAQDIAVNVADNDEAGVVITMVDGPVRVFESLFPAETRYAIVLTRSPEEAVQVTAVPTLPRRSEARAGGLGVMLNGKLDGVSLLFDRTNWFVPQYIKVSAPADGLAEGSRDVLIQHSVQQGGSPDDGGAYDKLSVPTVVANVVDENAAGVLILPGTQPAIVTEPGPSGAGTTYTYSVVLTHAPAATVTDDNPILVNVVTDAQVRTSVSQLAFTSLNWSEPQTVTVTAEADSLDEGFHYSRITHQLDASVSLDDFYGITLDEVTHGLAADIKGDDGARFTVTSEADNIVTVRNSSVGGTIDARILSETGVAFSGTGEVTAPFAKNMVLSGTAAVGDVWSVTLDGRPSFVHLVNESEQSLDAIARSLRDSINLPVLTTQIGRAYTVNGSATGTDTVSLAVPATAAQSVSSVTLVGASSRVLIPATAYSLNQPARNTLLIRHSELSLEAQALLAAGEVTVDVVFTEKSPYSASVLGSTLIISRYDRATLAASGNVVGPDATAAIAIQSVSVYDKLDIHLSGSVQAGASWSVMLNGEVFTYVAGGSGQSTNIASVDLKIGDEDVAGVLVRESGGGTSVIEPSDLVLLGGGQIRQLIEDGVSIQMKLDPASAAITGEVTISTSSNTNSKIRATISGSSILHQFDIALSGEGRVGDKVTVFLSGDNGATYSDYSVTVTSDSMTLKDVADALVMQISTVPPAGVLAESVTVNEVTQFVADFGTAIMRETPSHDNAFNAQPIDFGMWGTSANPDILDDTVPHLTIKGSGNGETDFYKFVITQAMIDAAIAKDLAGTTGVNARFDIDHGYEGNAFETYWAAQLLLYQMINVNGALVANPVLHQGGDKDGMPVASEELDPANNDDGSSTQLDGLLNHNFTQPGTYVVEVRNWLGPKVSPNRSLGIPQGVLYDLNISIPEHHVAKFTFAPYPVLERESLQDSSLQFENLTSSTAAQDINDAGVWFTFNNRDIGNGIPIDEAGGFDSSVPYVSILGSGDGTYDEYRFEIKKEMLISEPGNLDGSTNDNDAPHTYYSMVQTTLLGGVGDGDEWTVAINGRPFTFVATSVNADGVNDLAEVAAGLKQEVDKFKATRSENTVPTYTLTAAENQLTIEDENGFWISLTQKVASAGVVTRQLSNISSVLFAEVNVKLQGVPEAGETWELLFDHLPSGYSVPVESGMDLDDIGTALAALDGHPSEDPTEAGNTATYDAATRTLTITGLAGKQVAFAVTGDRPNGWAIIGGMPIQDASLNVTEAGIATAEETFWTKSKITLGGEVHENQVWQLTLTDSSDPGVTVTKSYPTEFQDTLADIVSGFDALDDGIYSFSPSDGDPSQLTISRIDGGRFSVNVFVEPVTANGDQETSGTESHYSAATIDLTGTVVKGDLWSVGLTNAQGKRTTYEYEVADFDEDTTFTLADVALGLKQTIETLSHAAFDVVVPEDSHTLSITRSDSGVFNIDFPAVNSANAKGAITEAGTSTPAVESMSINLAGLTATDKESWTLTIDGSARKATIGTDKLADGKVVTTRDDLGKWFVEQFAGSDCQVTYTGTILEITSSSKASFVVTLEPGKNANPTPEVVYSDTKWESLDIELDKSVQPGEVWSLKLDSIEHSATVGVTTLADTTVIDSRSILADYFMEKFAGAGYTMKYAGGKLTISVTNGAALTAEYGVLAPIPNSLTGIVSHWSVANITFSGIPSAGETWGLVLTHPDPLINEDLTYTYVVNDADLNGSITLDDVAMGFADLIGDGTAATAEGSVLTFCDAAGVSAMLTITPAAVSATAALSGTVAGVWLHTIKFDGGTDGQSSTGDIWKMQIADQDLTVSPLSNGFGSVATGVSEDPVFADGGSLYEIVAVSGNTLSFVQKDGGVAQITEIEQTRNRTTVLIAGPNADNAAIEKDRPHYSEVELVFDADTVVFGGDVWSVTLNGHVFTYTAKGSESPSGIAEKLAETIDDYSDVYHATSDGSTITITPDTKAWFTGIVTKVTVGGGVVRGLFDIDNTNAVIGSEIVNGVLVTYSDSLFLSIFDATTGLPIPLPDVAPETTRNTGVSSSGPVDAGSTSYLDPFLTFDFTVKGEYIVRVGSYRNYDDPLILDTFGGVSAGTSYQLNVSLQRHETNTDAIELVGKQISIVDGAGQNQTAIILAYDADLKTYTVDKKWDTDVNDKSQFEIEYHLRDEFSGYEPVGDQYSVQLTRAPAAETSVTLDVLPQITRTYNSGLAFVAEANYGESAGYQVTVATPQVLVELRGTPVAGRFWTLTLNGKEFAYEVKADDDLFDIATELAKLISLKPELNGAEIFVPQVVVIPATTDPVAPAMTNLLISSSLYQGQINDSTGTVDKATRFTTQFLITRTQGTIRLPEPAGSARISDRNAVSGWLSTEIELAGNVHTGSSWTLRLDGTNYTYEPRVGDTLSSIATALWKILPDVYKADADSLTGESFVVSRTDKAQFKVSFTVLAATHIRPQLVFTSASWDRPQDVKVLAVDDTIVDGGDAKVVAAVEGRVNAIRGPLAINGGLLVGVDRSLNNPFLLPGEKNNPIRDGQIESAGIDENGDAWLTDTESLRVDPANGLIPGFDPRMNNNYYGFTILDGAAAGTFLRVKSVEAAPESLTERPVTAPAAPAATATLTLNDTYGFMLPADQSVAGVTLHQGTLSVRVLLSNFEFDRITNTITIEDRNLVIGVNWDVVADQPVTATIDLASNKVTFVGGWTHGIPLAGSSYYYAPINPNVLVDEADQVDTLIVDNSDSPSHDTGILTETQLSGLGMGPDTVIGTRSLAGGITYLNLESLEIGLGFGNDTLTIESTHAGATTVRSGAGNDTINVQSIVGHTFIESGTGRNEINVASTQNLVDEIGGLLTVLGGDGEATLNVDDTGDSADNVGILTGTTLTGLDMPGVSEVQVLTVLAAGGNYRLSYGEGDASPETELLSYDASAAELQVALNTLLGSTGIRVDKFRDSAKTVSYTITFGGDLAGRNMAQLAWTETPDSSQLAAATDSSVNVEVVTRRDGTTAPQVNTVQTLTVNATTGTFRLEFRMDTETLAEISRGLDKIVPALKPTVLLADKKVLTGPLRYNISEQDLASYLDPILNPNNSDNGLPHTRNFEIVKVGSVYVISFVGAHRGRFIDAVDTTELRNGLGNGGVEIATRARGINYYGIETLNVKLGSGNDVANIQSTAAGTVTNVYGNAGNDHFYVSSLANHGPADSVAILKGTVDLIQGVLNLDGGTNTNLLMISDEASTAGDTNVLITDQPLGVPGVNPKAEISMSGLAAAAITWRTDANGTFADGVTIFSGSGDDTITVDGTHKRNGIATTTTLYTGYGDDRVTVNLDATTDGSFVLDTQGPYNDQPAESDSDIVNATGSSSGIDITTGQGTDYIVGGSGNDTIRSGKDVDYIFGGDGNDDIDAGTDNVRDFVVGDSGFLQYKVGDTTQQFQTTDIPIAGVDPVVIGFADFRTNGILLSIGTSTPAVGANDKILTGLGDDVVFGGVGNDTINTSDGRNVVLGDNGSVIFNTAGQILTVTTTSAVNGGADNITTGTGDDIVFGGSANDTISASNGKNVVAGDNVRVTFDVNGQIRTIDTIDPAIGGNDTINTGLNDDIVLGGTASDTITTTSGNNVILGDNGSATINASGILQTVTATDPTNGGVDTITSGSGNDLIIAGTGKDTVSSDAGNDLVFGDHGRVTGTILLTQLPLNSFSPAFTFTSVFTQNSDLGGDDFINAGTGDDIAIGGQGFDRILGGSGDDDMIGGHNVADGNDSGDWIDGGSGHDTIAGDNAYIHREPRTTDTRWRTLTGTTILGVDGNGSVNATAQVDPSGTAKRTVTLFNHTATTAPGLYGNDRIAGGSGNDTIFGQFGNDAIQGDGAVMNLSGAMIYDIAVSRLSVDDIDGPDTDGDDYIEGGGGNDTIMGNLGQDDLIGGSSNLFGTPNASDRPDGGDVIFGGSGNHAGRNDLGDQSLAGHSRDADVILGDNGNILRIVGVNGVTSGQYLTFNYDAYGPKHIIPRTTQYLDYAFGDPNNTTPNDEIHGESGDDVIHGMSGNDVIFGDAQDDDIIGGAGNDRIFGGAGEDGILGDDGRIMTSRNGLTEPLRGITTVSVQAAVNLQGTLIGALTNITGRLKKSVDLAQYYVGGHDIIYGGLGDDFIHGGAGDDALSGAEATNAWFITTAQSDTSILKYNATARKFAAYNAADPLSKIDNFVLNFDATDGSGNKIDDGMDNIFGDEGNDWLVGGTMNDRMFGGMGDDLLNGDDNLETNGSLNNSPDVKAFADADFVFGGGGYDVLIANTAADRLIDWSKHFNTYVVPILWTQTSSSVPAPTVLRDANSQIINLLVALGDSGGIDDNTEVLANQFYSELGLVTIEDGQVWQDQVQLSLARDPKPTNLFAGIDPLGGFEVLPTAGIQVSESTVTVSEYGTSRAVNVSLKSPPAQNVVLSIVSPNTAEVTISTSTLTFTPLNWNIPQAVTVTGVDDTIVDGPKTVNVTISVNAAMSSSAYATVTSKTIAVTNNDNELSRPTIDGPTAVTDSQRPVITWSNDPGAAGYSVFVRNLTTGVNRYIIATSATNSFLPTADLGIGVFLVWVQSFRSDGIKGIWSAARRFRINTPVAINTLTTLQTSPRPTITWAPIAGAVRYDIWVNNLSTGESQIVRDANITSTSWSPATDMPIAAYRVWIRAIDVTGTAARWSRAVDFRISLPVILDPPTAVQSIARPTVTWSPLAGAVRYDVWVDNLTTGQWQVVRDTNVTATRWTPTADLPLATYRMWVRGIDVSGRPGQWSDVARFRIATAPTAVGPLNSTFDQTPTFTWSPVAGAAKYTFQLRNMNTGVNLYIVQNLTTTTWTAPTNLPNGNYRWWSAAIGTNSQPACWSAPSNFSIGGLASFTTTAGTLGTTPTFNWLAVGGAATYEIQINRIDVVQLRVVRVNNITGTSFTVPTPLTAGGTYRIWIRAIGIGGELGKWSRLDFTVAAANAKDDSTSQNLVSLDPLDNLIVELLNDQNLPAIDFTAKAVTKEGRPANEPDVTESTTTANSDNMSEAALTEIDDLINLIVTDLLISEDRV